MSSLRELDIANPLLGYYVVDGEIGSPSVYGVVFELYDVGGATTFRLVGARTGRLWRYDKAVGGMVIYETPSPTSWRTGVKNSVGLNSLPDRQPVYDPNFKMGEIKLKAYVIENT